MCQDNQQEKTQDKKRLESLEEFSKRVGLKHIKGEKGGVQFCPGTFLVKQLQSQRPPEK
jgi:hypothetical protein